MYLPRDRSDACCGVGAACGPDGTHNVNIVVPLSEAPRLAGRRQAYFEERLRASFPRVWDWVKEFAREGELQSVGCFGHHTKRATDDGAVLVGDAATFIHPFTGEGVYFALRGAQLAAETIGQALARGDASRHGLRGYDAARRRELLPRYQLCDAVQRLVHSPAPARLDGGTPAPVRAADRGSPPNRGRFGPARRSFLLRQPAAGRVYPVTHAHRKYHLYARRQIPHLPARRRHSGLAGAAAALPGRDRLRADR